MLPRRQSSESRTTKPHLVKNRGSSKGDSRRTSPNRVVPRREYRNLTSQATNDRSADPISGGVKAIRGGETGINGKRPICLSNLLGSRPKSPLRRTNTEDRRHHATRNSEPSVNSAATHSESNLMAPERHRRPARRPGSTDAAKTVRRRRALRSSTANAARGASAPRVRWWRWCTSPSPARRTLRRRRSPAWVPHRS
jgi:hypothetical protein